MKSEGQQSNRVKLWLDASPIATLVVIGAAVAGFVLASANGIYTLYGAWRDTHRELLVSALRYGLSQPIWVPETLIAFHETPWSDSSTERVGRLSTLEAATGQALTFVIERDRSEKLIKAIAWPMTIRFSNNAKESISVVSCDLIYRVGEEEISDVRSFAYQLGYPSRKGTLEYNSPIATVAAGSIVDVPLTFLTLQPEAKQFVSPKTQTLILECRNPSGVLRVHRLLTRRDTKPK